jgi:hypothetical protein
LALAHIMIIESNGKRTSAAPWEPSPFIGRRETIAIDPARMPSVLLAHARIWPVNGIVRTREHAVTSMGGMLAASVVVSSPSAVSVFGTSPHATTYFAWTAPGSAIRRTTPGVHRVTLGAAGTSCALAKWSAATTSDASFARAVAELRHLVNAIRRRNRFTFSDELRALLRQAADAHTP